ncbi:fatty acid--CoA ligase [Streptomyces alfalfae]|uniref:Long-chain fatty acid--CoA ligase n=1 Tax=Streptomyces alfalfae TaxID=1642299 RepID=A0ABM6GSI1_9ACTN|nr:fatty acid--CoA ligase [Streptomyces alfalfae]AYA16954.1 fatty acid--CoA ligase [Streptomyces fradiae]APY86568.1 long-chain fatty acid--CoA ligase [Streptomyces alfalfae]QUI33664.1 fatty acid--CoA ligase [Streptomyces alfalfae]RXX42114.1 fatty acid--CoA ligase [Streptomyces alfalfae]RZM84369.1 fatty acid--CoA ligase [Streptomyces alfalfae]
MEDHTTRDWTLTRSSRAHAGGRAEHAAIVCEGRTTTYAKLHRESNRAAHALRDAGIGTGDRVAYLGRESENYYLTILACAKAGAVLVPVNWRLTRAEVDHILRDSGAALLFVDDEFWETADRVKPHLPGLRTVVRVDGTDSEGEPARGTGLPAWYANHPTTDLEPGTGPDDAVVQIYTSGTTGLPKGAVLPHRSFFTLPAAMREHGVDWIDWLPDDVSLISLPGFGIAGIGWFMHTFNAGATSVVMPQFIPQEAVRLIREHKVTITFAAPAMLQMMMAERGAGPEAFASMRKIAYGAAPMSETLLTRCLEVFGCEFAQIYASTETGSVAVCLPPEAHRPGAGLLRSVGRPCPGNEVKVIGPDGETLPPGETGQICVRAPSKMLGYWNLPEATERTMVGEWLHMGDAGYLDEDGYVYLRDRMNDTIIVAGQNIYPAEVEKALAAHPAVSDAAVVGLPDTRWGEAVHAVVVLRPGAMVKPRELLLALRGKLADYKIPGAFHFADDLPRNPSGKILRRAVREQLTAASAGTPARLPLPAQRPASARAAQQPQHT